MPWLHLHPNPLGSTTTTTEETGNSIENQLFYPYGQEWAYGLGQHDVRFAGMSDRVRLVTGDPDEVMDFTPARVYQPRLYRGFYKRGCQEETPFLHGGGGEVFGHPAPRGWQAVLG